MALAPQFVGHRMGSVFAPHTLEVYLDYVVSKQYLDASSYKKVCLQNKIEHSVLSQPKSTKKFVKKFGLIFKRLTLKSTSLSFVSKFNHGTLLQLLFMRQPLLLRKLTIRNSLIFLTSCLKTNASKDDIRRKNVFCY